MNLPNKLSVLRLILIPVFIAAFYIDFPYNELVAAGVFAASAFTDFLDGKIARKYNLVTDLGKFLDSSADKVLVLSALTVICTAGILPPVLAGVGVSVIIAREILVSCLRMVAASKGLVMAADKLGKVKTFFQDITILELLVYAALTHTAAAAALKWTGWALFSLSILLTIASGVNYFVGNAKVLGEIDK